MDETRVLLDSDFCNMITDINSQKIDSRKLLENLISVIGKVPYIHEYLVKEELFSNTIIQDFIANGKIKVLKKSEITQNGKYIKLYEDTFEEYFNTLNEEDFSQIKGKSDCFSFRKQGYNLGEIHSLIAARFLSIPLFYSNDNGARSLAKKYDTQDNIVKLISGLDLMIEYNDVNLFDRNTRRAIFTKYEKAHWKEQYNEAVKCSLQSP